MQNNMRPLSWGDTNGKDPTLQVLSILVTRFGSFPLEPPQLSGQITYSPPPNHGKYTIMGGYNGKDPTFLSMQR